MSSEFVRTRLSREFEQALRVTMTSLVIARGATIYQHGSIATGIYLVEEGSVRVLLPVGEGQGQLLEVAGPGTLLGLSESMAGGRYRVTVEAEQSTIAAFLPREHFLRFLEEHHEFCIQVVQLLSENLHGLYHRFRSVSAHPGRPRRRSPEQQLN